jgi:PAS domain S-box-containing protein
MSRTPAPSLKSTPLFRYLLILLAIVVWLGVCAWLATAVYTGVRGDTSRQMADLQATLADQAARSISDHMAGLQKEMELLAQDEDVIAMNARGVGALQRYFDYGGGELQSVTRMGADGTIVFTWPNAASRGSSIREQAHVRRLLGTHRPVMSDVFLSVQGFRSIALHVPVFHDGTFDGSIGILVPVEWIARRFLEGIRIGPTGYAWVIDRNGVEIYCPDPGLVGTNAIERAGQSAEEKALARAMASGFVGNAVLSRDHVSGAPIGLQVTYMPIHLADNMWSIAVAATESEILAKMSGFVRPWLVVILLVLAGVACIIIMGFRFTLASDRRRVREEEQAHYRSIVERLPVINYVVDMNPPGRTTYISPQVQTILGFTPEAWTADPDMWRRQIHPDDRARVEEEVRRRDARGEPVEIEYRAIAADGSVRWILNRSTVSRGEPVSVTGVMIDITERRQAEEALREREEQLLQARKLEAVGRLAGGVAHDFNNLLTVIRGYTDTILDSGELPESLRADTREILAASRRAQSLTDQLLAYSRKQMHSPHVIDLNTQVVQMEMMLRRLIGENVSLVVALTAEICRVRADPGQLQQVIMNLAVNARDAMPGGGTLTICSANVLVGSVPDPARPGVTEGAWVSLSVRDTGEGMDAETLTHIFEPFFTTKSKGKGTGLGLSTVYGIVAQSGGLVFVQSSPGAGSVFEIYLPRAAGEITEAPLTDAGETARPATFPGHGRILLVEDEPVVRELARSILVKAGYTVITAGNGREALALYATLADPIDLLLTDVVMPVMGGAELARRVRALRPDMKVIYVTGYADDALGVQGELAEGINLLRKPFSGSELVAIIARILGTSIKSA